MSYIDIIIAIPLLWGLYKGFSRGLIIEAVTFIAFGLAIWGGIKFHDFLSGWIKDFLGWNSKYLSLVSYVLIFIGVLLITFGIGKLIQRLAESLSLGFVNKLAGGVFGMLKFGLLMSMIIFFLEAINKSVAFIPHEIKDNSLLYIHVQKIAPTIIPELNEIKWNKIMPVPDTINVKVK